MKTIDMLGTLTDLNEPYKGSWYTIAGCGGNLYEWVEGYNGLLETSGIGTPTVWAVMSGAQVNAYVGEDNTNPFQDDCTLLAFPLDGLNVGKLAMFKIANGDRWFDDVIDNMRPEGSTP